MEFFILTYTGKPIGESGESCGTIYNLENACPVCGTGAQPLDDLHVKRLNNIKTPLFQTYDGDFLIHEDLYDELILDNLGIGRLKKVVNWKNNNLPFFYFNPQFHFPKTKVFNGLIIENQCPFCKRNGYFNDAIIGCLEKNIPTIIKDLKPDYDKIAPELLKQSEFFNSWEHLGLSNKVSNGNKVVRYARPLLIVSDSLRAFLEKRNLNQLKYSQFNIGE